MTQKYNQRLAARIMGAVGYAASSFPYLQERALARGVDLTKLSSKELQDYFAEYRERIKALKRDTALKVIDEHRRPRGRDVTEKARILGISRVRLYKSANDRGLTVDQEFERRMEEKQASIDGKYTVRTGRPPERGVSLQELAESVGMTRCGLWRAARKNGRTVDEELALRRKLVEADVISLPKREPKPASVRRDIVVPSPDMTTTEAKEALIDELMLLGDAPSDETIGLVARRISMLVRRIRMSQSLFVSFAKESGVTSRESSMLAVIEAIPLMNHLSFRARTTMLVAMSVMYKQKASPKVVNAIITGIATVGDKKSKAAIKTVYDFFVAHGVRPDEDVVREAYMILGASRGDC